MRIKRIVLNVVFVAMCLLAGQQGFTAQVAIIAHPSVTEENLDKDLLFDMYRGDVRTWEDGSEIKVWDLGERGDIRKSFYKFIGKRPSRMKSIWMRQLLTGEGEPPDVAKSQEEMLENVIATAGSIGYIGRELVDERVKLLLVIEEKK